MTPNPGPREEPDDEPNRDPAQASVPEVDTSTELIDEYSAGDLATLSPAAFTIFLAFVCLVFDVYVLAAALGILGIATFFLCFQFMLSSKARSRTSPRELIQNTVAYLRLRWGLPWDRDTTVERRFHGTSRLFSDGTAEMDDGRLVGILKFGGKSEAVDGEDMGRNTYGMSDETRNQLVASFSQAIDEDIKDFGFSFYSTTRQPDTEEFTDTYEGRIMEFASRGRTYAAELYRDVTEWYRGYDTPNWDAREWHHYLVVEVTPGEVEAEPHSSRGWRSALPFGSSSDEYRTRQLMQRELEKRLTVLETDLVGSVDGLHAERVTPDEHAALVLSYWKAEEFEPDTELHHAWKRSETGPTVWEPSRWFQSDDADVEAWRDGEPGNTTARDRLSGQRAATDGSDVDSGTTTAFSPSHFDASSSHIEVGSQYAKTFHLSEWPIAPESVMLEDLFTMRGTDLDVHISVSPEDRQSVVAELRNDRATMGAEADEKVETGDLRAEDIESDAEAYALAYPLLRDKRTQSWRVNGYCTVRAGERRAIEEIETSDRDYSSLDAAKLMALQDASDTVRDCLMGAPANLSPDIPTLRHYEAFRSCAPTSRDHYDEATRVDKTTRLLGGGVGALFPPCSDRLFEPEGMDWGRNSHDGRHVRADPFDRGAAPHKITIGQSRSGKTYETAKVYGRWYHARDDRTLIVCDTQSGFDGLTKLCNGTHIVVDGSQTINPLDIQPIPEHQREAAGGRVNPFRMKIDEATQFVCGILRAQGVDPGAYTSSIEEGLEITYEEAGIVPHDLDSHARESPTPSDFLETLDKISDEPKQFTFGSGDAEAATKKRKAGELLDFLSGFKDRGKYADILGEDETGIMDPDVDMVYLDLQQFQDQSDIERSAMLQLMLSQVSQKIKRAPGQSAFVIDEAHVLLQNTKMCELLEKNAREWARYEAMLDLVSQHPNDFVSDVGSDTSKDKIRAQCSTVQFFRTPDVKAETLSAFGLNTGQINTVKNELVTGKSGRGYSECLMQFQDRQGWWPIYVEASPYEDTILNYAPRKHGDWESYIRSEWGEI